MRHTGWVTRLAIAIVLGAACGMPPPAATQPTQDREDGSRPAARFLKGQLHLHSSNSGDSKTPPAEVAQWYAQHGYDFIVFTDHNRVTHDVVRDDLLVIPGVELTFNVQRCDPPSQPPLCPLHVNALFVDPTRTENLGDVGDLRRTTVYRHLVAQARALGGLPQLNHPNFHYGADVETIAAVVDGPLLLEVANEAIDSNNQGDSTHPSTFEIWDALLARGLRVWGTATDDAHHYADADAVRAKGELAFEGDRGFVFVRGDDDPSIAEIEDAMARGDFYASNGALLDDVACAAGVLTVWPSERDAKVRCIGGTPAKVEADAHACEVGAVYVRAEIVDARGRRAWTQPCFGQ